MYINRDENKILLAFLALSLLFHLLLLLLMPELSLFPEADKSTPVYVEMRSPTHSRELDLPKTADQPRETPAKRLGPSDQVVKREMAPKGDAIEDQAASLPSRQQPTAKPDKARSETGEIAKPATPELTDLLTLPNTTADRLASQLRTKYRAEVDEGDTIWLDTEKDILISFYQRLRSGIYRVWNYPVKSKERGEDGYCLIRMSFNLDGSVKDVELVESSGFPRLDREAVAAVYKGAPYGKLPDAYKKEDLSILAFFQYAMHGTYISN